MEQKNFNPRHPYGWRRFKSKEGDVSTCISIHATHTGGDDDYVAVFGNVEISIHATHTGGDLTAALERQARVISIHATHTGGDLTERLPCQPFEFQSTPPIRVATRPVKRRPPNLSNFNPRHPYGWRLRCAA